MASSSDFLFFQLFRQHWEAGTSLEMKAKARDGKWTFRTFASAMGHAGIKTLDPNTVEDWLHGNKFPQKSRKEAILNVFFPQSSVEKGEINSCDNRRLMENAWQTKQSADLNQEITETPKEIATASFKSPPRDHDSPRMLLIKRRQYRAIHGYMK